MGIDVKAMSALYVGNDCPSYSMTYTLHLMYIFTLQPRELFPAFRTHKELIKLMFETQQTEHFHILVQQKEHL